jgi:hypothetical protein
VTTLEQHLVRSRIAGEVDTPRRSNLDNARRFAAGEPDFLFGLAPLRPWSYEEVVALMVERAGIDPDLTRTTGPDTIDASLTMAALQRMRDRLARAAARRERVLVATGHPTGTLELHLAMARALRAARCTLLNPAAGVEFTVVEWRGTVTKLHLRHVGGVAMFSNYFDLQHSHSPVGMTTMLEALADAGGPPDLVVADHGMAGAAAAAGIDVVCFADCNDPGLFVGEAEGRVRVTVPLDDNVQPHLYEPLSEFLIAPLATH